MKKINLLLIAFILSFTTLSFDVSAQTMTGLALTPSSGGPGIAFRQWANPKVGWGIDALTNWGFSDIIGRARFMYAFHATEKTKFYGLLSAGYMLINHKEDGVEFSLSAPSAVAGLGAELFIGNNKNTGIGFEVGYQYGQADYTLSIDVPGYGKIESSDTFKLFPVYIGTSLTHYFGK